MNTLPTILESKTKIRFQHCDPFNHLNNASYINYFMNHREDQLIEKYNLDIYDIAKKTGISWVVGSNQIAYFKPALLMETVLIESQLIHFNTSELYVEMRMYDENKTHLKSVLWTSFIHFNLMKLERNMHSEEYMKLFKSVHTPIETKIFEARAKQLNGK